MTLEDAFTYTGYICIFCGIMLLAWAHTRHYFDD